MDEVLAALDVVVDRAEADGDRAGYFAALYRRVTRAVKAGIAAGRFENGERLARLDVAFARRYLDAQDAYRTGGAMTRSWRVAFGAVTNPLPLVVQQLLAGINAHINLDLAIASVAVSPGAELDGLRTDFNQINALLAEQVGTVEAELAEVSPLIGLLEQIDMRTQTRIINFSLTKARDLSWQSAQRINMTPPLLLPITEDGMDVAVAALGLAIVNPPPAVVLKLAPIRAVENNDVRVVLKVLARD